MRILCVSIEASGDRLLASILRTIKKMYSGSIELMGLGGKKSQMEGLQSVLDPKCLAAHGLTEALDVLPKTLSAYHSLKQIALESDVCVLVDAPEINLRLLRWIRSHSNSKVRQTKVIYVAPPQAWAWRPKRVRYIALADEVICLFKFESEWLKMRGVSTHYIGHPLVNAERLHKKKLSLSQLNKYPILTIAFFPGSRASSVKATLLLGLLSIAKVAQETKRNVSIQVAATHWISTELYKSILSKFDRVIHTSEWSAGPVNTPNQMEWYHHRLELTLTCHLVYVNDDCIDSRCSVNTHTDLLHPALKQAHLALCQAGTSTLESAVAQVPPLTIAPLSWFSAYLARFLIKVDHCSLPNLCLNRRAFPEIHCKDCTEEKISKQLISMIENLHSYSFALEELRTELKPWSLDHIEDVLELYFGERDCLSSD